MAKKLSQNLKDKNMVMMTVNKSEAVRSALRELGKDAKAADVADFVWRKHKIKMENPGLSVTVSNEKKKMFNGGAVPTSTNYVKKVLPAALQNRGEISPQLLEFAKKCGSGDVKFDEMANTIRSLKGLDLEAGEKLFSRLAQIRQSVPTNEDAVKVFELAIS